jgi:hypothetical protein
MMLAEGWRSDIHGAQQPAKRSCSPLPSAFASSTWWSWAGALIFFVFQVISRVPIVTVLGQLLASELKASTLFLYTWLAILALSAGVFEEVGRYIGYRWLMRREEKTWNKAVMYGLPHTQRFTSSNVYTVR